MKYFYMLSLYFFLQPFSPLFSQVLNDSISDRVKEHAEHYQFRSEDWAGRFNKDFAKLLGASGDNVSIGSFASLDLVNPKFNFNGAVPIVRNDDRKPISIISIGGQGSLDADNIAYVFSNRKKSSAGSITLAYHFGLRFENLMTGLGGTSLMLLNEYTVEGKKSFSYSQLQIKRADLGNQISKYQAEVENLNIRNIELSKRVVALKNDIDNIKGWYYRNQTNAVDIKNLNEYTKQHGQAIDSTSMNSIQIKKNEFLIDSLKAEQSYISADIPRRNSINQVTAVGISRARNDLFFYRYALKWWSLDFSYSRNKIFLYDSLAPYLQRISPKTFNLISAGFGRTYYRKDQLHQYTFLVKVGLSYSRAVNMEFYDTIPISEEVVSKDSLGTTTRKTVTNYSVYTDAIQVTDRVRLYGDAFLFLNNSAIGLHIFPEFVSISPGGQMFNFGAGVVTSLRNQKKDVPLINLELFGKFHEIGKGKSNRIFPETFLLGIKFSLPFNFF
jgi:hypothetical protein